MKTKILLILFLFAFVACERVDILEKGEANEIPSFDFEVPADFTWDIHKSIEVSVKIADLYAGKLNYGVEIYAGEVLLSKGLVNGADEYKTVVSVEKITTDLTVVQLDPNGRNAVEIVSLDGSGSVEVDFDAPVESVFGPALSRSSSSGFSSSTTTTTTAPGDVISSPGVPSDATPVTDQMTKLTETAKPYVLRRWNNKITEIASGVTLYIAEGGILGVYVGSQLSKSTIIILRKGRLVGRTTKKQVGLTLINYPGGEINIYGDLDMEGGSFKNYSDAFCYNMYLKDVELETNGLLMIGVRKPGAGTGGLDEESNGDWYSGVDFETGTGVVKMTNTTVVMKNHFTSENLELNGGSITFDPHAWINVTDKMKCVTTTIKGSSNTKRSAVIKAKSLVLVGVATKNIGRLVLDTEDGILIGEESAHWDKIQNLGATGPNDETNIAICNHPVLQYNDGGYNAKFPDDLPDPGPVFFKTRTILMEDSAPGDMDMNDFVCEWQLGSEIKSTLVTKILLRYKIIALGSTKELAGAVALRIDKIAANDINNIKFTRNGKTINHDFSRYFNVTDGLEVDNGDVVIPLFEDAHNTFFGIETPSFVNTFKVEKGYYTFDVEVELNKGISQTALARADIDFFLVVSGNKTSRVEINLYGNKLTSKASNTEFGFSDNREDDSSDANFVSGLELGEGFAYPKELQPIENAYPNFMDWAKSNGLDNQTWYNFPDTELVIKPSN